MSLDDLCLAPIQTLAAQIERRSLSPVELTEVHLARIDRLDGTLHSYLTVTAEQARAEARQAEQEISRGWYRGPLHGIPVGLKDLFDTAGVRTTGGSRILADRIPTQDSTVASRLRAAGAVLLGKQTMHEFAIGLPDSGDYFPPPRNPWDLERTPGGSSSGTGAALAAGLCAGGMGSDTGGSIRNPAAFSGIVGLKPTYGLVSRHGVISLSWSLDHAGPMARTVADVAVMLQATAGYDPADPASANEPVPAYLPALSGSAHGVRIGVPRSDLESVEGIETDLLRVFYESLDVLARLGAEVRDVTLPVEEARIAQPTIMLAEAVAFHEPWLRTRRQEYGRGFQDRVLRGLFYTATDYIQALRARAAICRDLEDVMATIDLVAAPAVPRVAPTYGEDVGTPARLRGLFTGIFNLTGQPSISVPCGFDRRGLPIGLMLSGRAFDERTVLRVADAYEFATEWHLKRPPLVAGSASG
jgi:aspartyl-tRNA(Asn)/glutamyl-tRNA(Gln) amidotransferase subunit A